MIYLGPSLGLRIKMRIWLASIPVALSQEMTLLCRCQRSGRAHGSMVTTTLHSAPDRVSGPNNLVLRLGSICPGIGGSVFTRSSWTAREC